MLTMDDVCYIIADSADSEILICRVFCIAFGGEGGWFG